MKIVRTKDKEKHGIKIEGLEKPKSDIGEEEADEEY